MRASCFDFKPRSRQATAAELPADCVTSGARMTKITLTHGTDSLQVQMAADCGSTLRELNAPLGTI